MKKLLLALMIVMIATSAFADKFEVEIKEHGAETRKVVMHYPTVMKKNVLTDIYEEVYTGGKREYTRERINTDLANLAEQTAILNRMLQELDK